MLGTKIIDNETIKLNKAGFDQFNVLNKELDKLCEITHMGWDLTLSRSFDKALMIEFAAGLSIGTGIGFLSGYLLKRHRKNKKK